MTDHSAHTPLLPLFSVKKNSCSGEYGSVAALVAGMLFFGVAGVSEKFAVVLWSTIVFSNGVAVVEGCGVCRLVPYPGLILLFPHV